MLASAGVRRGPPGRRPGRHPSPSTTCGRWSPSRQRADAAGVGLPARRGRRPARPRRHPRHGGGGGRASGDPRRSPSRPRSAPGWRPGSTAPAPTTAGAGCSATSAGCSPRRSRCCRPAPASLDGLLDRVETLPDADFLSRLPALRGGFQAVSPAGRDRLLAVVEQRLGDRRRPATSPTCPRRSCSSAARRPGGRRGARRVGLTPPTTDRRARPGTVRPSPHRPRTPAAGAVDGRRGHGRCPQWTGGGCCSAGESDVSVRARPATPPPSTSSTGPAPARAPGPTPPGGPGGKPPFPGVREWAEELSALFGPRHPRGGPRPGPRRPAGGRRAAARPRRGRPVGGAAETVLSLAGGMPEATVARLRPLVARIVEELTRQLATRLRPALDRAHHAAADPPARRARSTCRGRCGPTWRTTRRDDDGRIQVIPERPVFRTRARRGVDWRLVLVVDVSGSMEASVIWSALTGGDPGRGARADHPFRGVLDRGRRPDRPGQRPAGAAAGGPGRRRHPHRGRAARTRARW